MENQSSTSLFEMEIDTYAQNHIYTISRWGKFIAITGFIVLGIILLLMVFIGQQFILSFSELMPGNLAEEGVNTSEMQTILWLLVAGVIIYWLLYCFWCYFLLRASTLFRKGLITKNVADITNGFSSLRSFFVISIVIAFLTTLMSIYSMLNF